MGERDAQTPGELAPSAPVPEAPAGPVGTPPLGAVSGAGPSAIGAVGSVSASAGMRAAIARSVSHGRGNHELQRMLQPRPDAAGVLQRSPLSDELKDIWTTQGKAAFFDRLRALNQSDSDLTTFINTELSGDDQWLASNISQHGAEANWPIDLKVRREMKGWADSGGKTAVFDLLRTVGTPHSGNGVLATAIGEVFAGQPDDLWLGENLRLHGIETQWPIDLKVRREMKGWADSGGKTAVFDLLRTVGTPHSGNGVLATAISEVLAGQPDDLWLGENLRLHGIETQWPIDLKVRREMKGWADSGGKTAVFDLLRTVGTPHSGNGVLATAISEVFAGQPDDLWLGENLRLHGIETQWPIDLKVRREMKGWSDSGGKSAVFDILRAAGAGQAGNAALTTAINDVFAAGTEDHTLGRWLQQIGPETAWPAPTQLYQCPFDNAPQSSPGERIIFNGQYQFAPPAGIPHYHEIEYVAAGGAAWGMPGGATTQTFNTGPGLDRIHTDNQNLHIDAAWTGAAPITVTMSVRERSTNRVVQTRVWTFTLRGTAPTGITQVDTEAERPLPSQYRYTLGPDLTPGAPDYEHQTILESFTGWGTTLAESEFTPAWLSTHSVTSTAEINAKFFGGPVNNGTFTIDSNDQILDGHNGFQTQLRTLWDGLKVKKDVPVETTQTYSAGATTVGTYTLRHILKADGTTYAMRKIKI